MKCSKCESNIGDESRYFETKEYIPSIEGYTLTSAKFEHADSCPLILKEEYHEASIAKRALTMSEKASMLWSIAIYFEKNEDKIDHAKGRYVVNSPYPSCAGSHLNFLFSQEEFVNGEISSCGFIDGWNRLSCALGLAQGDLFTILEQFGASNPADGFMPWSVPTHKVFFKMRLVYSAMSYGL